MRAVLLVGIAAVVTACASHSQDKGTAYPVSRSQPPAVKTAAPASGTPTPSTAVTTPPRSTPSLEEERQAQAQRAAAAKQPVAAPVSNPGTAKTTPASAVPAAAAADADTPSWFSTTAKEQGGRVMVGAMADATTVRDAPRLATDAAKTALVKAVGSESEDVRVESTYVRREGGGYRAFVLVSCPGTIKK